MVSSSTPNSISAPAGAGTATDTAALRQWLRATAQPLIDTDSAYTGPDLEPLTDQLGSATVVGLGESTRFSRQTFGLRERIFRVLVHEHGYRALAVQDSARSGERMDAYVRTGAGDPESVLAGAWRPIRTAEMVATLNWIHAFNQEHRDDPVRIFGVQPPRAEPSDYDVVLDHVRDAAPAHLPTIESHLTTIRTAHTVDEHVQRHQGIHPGRPFIEHARDALTLFETLPRTAGFDNALNHLRFIVTFHQNSVAGKGSFAGDERAAAERVIEWHRNTGAKIAQWDGLAHTSAVVLGVGRSDPSEFRGTGSYLREHFGSEYVSVAIGFHHGDLGVTTAPEPLLDLVDAVLGDVDLPAFYVDIRGEVPAAVDQWRRRPAKLRTISGVYDPAKDADANITVSSLADAFDVLVHIREASPVRWLPQANA